MFSRFITAVAFLPLTGVYGQTSTGLPVEPQVVARGTGEVSAPAVKAIVTVGVETRGQSVERLSAENAARIARIRSALTARGIAADQITTRGYSVGTNEREMMMRPAMPGADTSRYIVRNTMRIEVRPPDAVGGVIDAAIAAGANQAYAAEYQGENLEGLRQRALDEAVRNARRDAETMARAAGGTLGELRELNNAAGTVFEGAMYDATPPPPPPMMMGTTVTPRPVTIRAQVVARWRLVIPPR